MEKIILLFIALISLIRIANAQSGWTAQSSGTSNYLYSVYFTDSNTGYAVGMSGTILKTTNGGNNWTAQSSGTSFSLSSVYFSDADTGYAVGVPGIILKTTNGGNNWTSQTSGTVNNLYSVFFTNANTGYAVGQNGTIIKTTNGGTNWTAQLSGTSIFLRSVYFPDANTGYAVGDSGTILKTINGGVSWIEDNRVAENNFVIYPNPTYDNVTIESSGNADIDIIEIHGRLIESLKIIDSKSLINLSKLSSGVYIMKIKTKDSIITKKIIKD